MQVPISLQLAILTVGLTALYMMIGQTVPQKEVQPPEVVEIATDVSTEELVAIGQEIYNGKGICYTCHANTSRFPDLQGIATRAATRLPGYTALDYLAESLYEPDVYIVEGFNPGMPRIDKPPIGLTDQEILAVIAYLQTLGGQATVTLDTKTVYTGGTLGNGDSPAGEPPAAADEAATAAGEAVAVAAPLEIHGCTGCHYADRPGKLKASSLYDIGARLDRERLYAALGQHERDPSLDRVTVDELRSLVEAMSSMKG